MVSKERQSQERKLFKANRKEKVTYLHTLSLFRVGVGGRILSNS